VQLYLAEKLMGKKAARVIVDRGGTLIAGRLNGEDAHGR
jgi:hypothetical protein